jgi:hypothetical protein
MCLPTSGVKKVIALVVNGPQSQTVNNNQLTVFVDYSVAGFGDATVIWAQEIGKVAFPFSLE